MCWYRPVFLHGDLLKPWSYYQVEEQWTFSTVFDKIMRGELSSSESEAYAVDIRWLWPRVWASEFDNPRQCLHLDFVMIFYGIKFSFVSKLVIPWFYMYTLYHDSCVKINFWNFFFFFFFFTNISCHFYAKTYGIETSYYY